MTRDRAADDAGFRIFRGADAPGIEESGIEKHMPDTPGPPPGVAEALADLVDPGYSHRVLFASRGMSLLHLWFKSGFMLPRHSHDTDCLYFVVSGTLKIGSTRLGKGDGFYVGADVPYTYTAGDEGVEVLEFRGAEQFYLKLLVGASPFWDKLTATMKAKQAVWPTEERPA